MAAHSFVRKRKRRKRLKSLIDRLTDNELNLPLGDNWTVAVAFAHLAFWDQRSLYMLRKWKQSGNVEPSPIDNRCYQRCPPLDMEGDTASYSRQISVFIC